MMFLRSLKLSGFLSFPPDTESLELTPLNVVIGPNGSGKSNLLEAFTLLRAAPSKLANVIREGGTTAEWLWKGTPPAPHLEVEAIVSGQLPIPELRYVLALARAGQGFDLVDERVENSFKPAHEDDFYFYYRYQHGRPAINLYQTATTTTPPPSTSTTTTSEPDLPSRGFRQLARDTLIHNESVLSQRKDAELYPELFWLGQQFEHIQIFRDWSFGRSAPLRLAQKTDLPSDELLTGSENLALVLNELQHSHCAAEFNQLMRRFLPRYERFSTRIIGNTAQFYLHESGLATPIPATRLSDGTIRFMAILALLLSPSPPPLLCIEEPELGLHPDAVALLADMFVAASERMQLIVTTHSESLISALTPQVESVLVCEHLGGTTIQRLEADRLKHWLDQYRLGEIWQMGEIGGTL